MQAGVYSRCMGMLLACLMCGAALCAQQPAAVQKENGVYTLHEDTHLVLLDVTVTDKHGHPVAGLTKDDFKLLEDGQPQTIKFFEEHAPVDPAEIAREKAAALAGLAPNTFTNYEPFTGRPVTVLLLNELFSLPLRDLTVTRLNPEMTPLNRRMIDAVQRAPPDTPFAIYLLDTELHLVQPITTDRALLLARINVLWKTAHFDALSSHGLTPAEDIPVRRSILSDAMQYLASSLKGVPGRKALFFFTGAFHCSVVGPGMEFFADCPELMHSFPNDSENYLCGLMDTLEQGRMSIYRYYPRSTGYGFGCPSSVDLGTSASYYTLYYTPTNGDWNGKYRATTVEVTEKSLHLAYRKGYYGTPDNVQAHYYTANRHTTAVVAPNSDGPAIAATVVTTGTADPATAGTAQAKSTQEIQLHRHGSAGVATGEARPAPNPAAATFRVQVIPADVTVVPATARSSGDKEEQEYRQLTLRLSMPANEFKIVRSDSGQYVARLLISAVAYAGGRLAPSNGSQGEQITVNFNGTEDPRIAKSAIKATLSLNILEHDKSRWLYVSVRDLATGKLGSMVIPMEQVKMPVAQ